MTETSALGRCRPRTASSRGPLSAMSRLLLPESCPLSPDSVMARKRASRLVAPRTRLSQQHSPVTAPSLASCRSSLDGSPVGRMMAHPKRWKIQRAPNSSPRFRACRQRDFHHRAILLPGGFAGWQSVDPARNGSGSTIRRGAQRCIGVRTISVAKVGPDPSPAAKSCAGGTTVAANALPDRDPTIRQLAGDLQRVRCPEEAHLRSAIAGCADQHQSGSARVDGLVER